MINVGDKVRKRGTRYAGTVVELDAETWCFGGNEVFATVEASDGTTWSTFVAHLVKEVG